MSDVLEQGSEERLVQETLRRIKRRFTSSGVILYDAHMLPIGEAVEVEPDYFMYTATQSALVTYWSYAPVNRQTGEVVEYFELTTPKHLANGDTLNLHLNFPPP